MKTILLLLGMFSFSICCYGQQETVTFPALKKELLTRYKADQKARTKWVRLLKKGKTSTKRYKKATTKLKDIDKQNRLRLAAIIEQHGWPTYTMVGEKGSKAAWLLAQHADRNPVFQEECLVLLKAAVDKGQANAKYYAYLYDRVQLAKGEKQLYATQSATNSYTKQRFFQAIAEEENVQQRREAMGFDRHVSEYAKSLDFEYTVPTPAEAKERAADFVSAYETNIAKAKAALQKEDYKTAADFYIQASYSDGSIKTTDLVATARAISLGQHKDAGWGYYFLMKAAVRGWEKIADFDSDKDFTYIKNKSPESWKDLMNVVDYLLAKKNKAPLLSH